MCLSFIYVLYLKIHDCNVRTFDLRLYGTENVIVSLVFCDYYLHCPIIHFRDVILDMF